MKIDLPKRIDETSPTIESKSIVVIGANGSGKTRFGSDIENRYNQNTHRISAHKSLLMPSEVSPTSYIRAESEYLHGHYGEDGGDSSRYKSHFKWETKPNTHLLNDYEKLMVLLHTQEYEESIRFRDNYTPGQADAKLETSLDKVQRIWEYVLPHRKLSKDTGSINVSENGGGSDVYSASEMSDGERIVFYLIGSIISAPDKAIVIVDEPEMHLHKSITKKLYDKIEIERADCTFIYLTHDIDFAISRQESLKIWARSFNGDSWDYEILEDDSKIPDQLYLEILGSRKSILFVEGDSSSIDYRLLQLVFDDYTIKPLGSCGKVIEITKSFNAEKNFHQIESFGLIDRDRRTDEEILHIKNENIWVTKLAEIENFLLLDEVVKEVASNMMKVPDDIFQQVRSNVITFFNEQKEIQALEHTKHSIDRIIKRNSDASKSNNISDLKESLSSTFNSINAEAIYNDFLDKFVELVSSKNYEGILEVFNNKGIIHTSGVIDLCILSTKNNGYLEYIIGLLKKDSDSSKVIKEAIIKRIEQ